MSTQLERFRDHCRAMADDPASGATDADRALWTQLADEADDRMAAAVVDENDTPPCSSADEVIW